MESTPLGNEIDRDVIDFENAVEGFAQAQKVAEEAGCRSPAIFTTLIAWLLCGRMAFR